MLHFVPKTPNPLKVEGDDTVLRALANNVPGVHVCASGGGISGSSGSGLAPALEVLQMYRNTPITGTGASVGSINLALLMYAMGMAQTQCYAKEFCSERFIKSGVMPWFNRTKVSIDYCAAVLYYKLRDAKPYHQDNQLHICVTNYETGEPAVLSPDLCDIKRVIRCIKASVYLPCVGKGYVMIDGVPYTDGEVGQGLLNAALESDPKLLLLSMSTPTNQGVQWSRTLQEKLMASRAMAAVPLPTKKAMLGRHESHAVEEAWVDEQLQTPLCSNDRVLPVTCRLSPTVGVDLVEQDPNRITDAVGSSYKAHWEMLRTHKHSK